jgi:hypothetical protein
VDGTAGRGEETARRVRSRDRRPRRAAVRSRVHLVVAFLSLLIGWAALPTPAAAVLQADVAAEPQPGYGRLVLTFKGRETLPGYATTFNNGVLVISFGEPVEAPLASVAQALGAYVLVARRDDATSSLRIAVQRQVRVTTQVAGERLYVDFLPATWSGPPPPVPAEVLAELAARTQAALARTRDSDPGRFGTGATARLAVEAARRSGASRLSFRWNVPFSADLSRDNNTVRIGFDRTGPVDLAAIVANPPPGIEGISAMTENGRLQVILTVAPGTKVRGFRDDGDFVVDLNAADGSEGRTIDLAGATPLAVAPPTKQPPVRLNEAVLGDNDAVAHPAAPDEAVPAAMARRPASVELTFGFVAPAAAAVFRRQDTIFLVFDGVGVIDPDAVRSSLGELARSVAVERVDGAIVVRIVPRRPSLAAARAAGSEWTVTIGDDVASLRRPLTVTPRHDGAGAGRLAIDLTGVGRMHRIADPIVGDTLLVVTASTPLQGIDWPRAFVGGTLLPTAQGVAVVADVDDLAAEMVPDGVVLTRPGGLALSPPGPPVAPVEVPGERPRSKAPDGRAFAPLPPGGFYEHERALQAEIIGAAAADRSAARLRLAQFYLGLRLAPEALGVLRLAAHERPALSRDAAFITLFAAGQTLMGRAKAGYEALSRGEVTDSADAALWRTIAAAELGRYDEARTAAQLALPVVTTYPADLAAMLLLAAAEAEMELGEAGRAQVLLSQIEPREIAADLRGELAVLLGRVMDASGRAEDAAKRYDEAAATGNRRSEAEAEYWRVTQAVRDGRIEAAAAIDRLKVLAFSWRGDQIELRTLRALANLQAKAGQWRDAFTSMRAADLVGPSSDEARLLETEMGRVFTSLYLDDKADALDPIEALTLYYDFRDLTPPGRLGDEIVRRLADRLVGVDLLGQAADLLAYQVDKRLHGAARAQIAADLAAVYLLDRRSAEALKVLNDTEMSGLTRSVERRRRLVQARALADTGGVDRALALLASLDGDDAARLKGEILWRARRWGEAATAIEATLTARRSDAAALSEAEAGDALRAAVAAALAHDDATLGRLKADFGARMATTGSAKAFAVVTQPETASRDDLGRVAAEVASRDALGGFMAEYRARYLNRAADPAAPGAAAPAGTPPATTPTKPA